MPDTTIAELWALADQHNPPDNCTFGRTDIHNLLQVIVDVSSEREQVLALIPVAVRTFLTTPPEGQELSLAEMADVDVTDEMSNEDILAAIGSAFVNVLDNQGQRE